MLRTHEVLLLHASLETRKHPLLRLSVTDAELVTTSILMNWCVAVAFKDLRETPIQQEITRPKVFDEYASTPLVPPATSSAEGH